MAFSTPSATNSGVGSGAVNYSLQFPDIATKIMQENAFGHPFQFMIDLRSKPTVNEKFQSLYDTMADLSIVLDDASTLTGTPSGTLVIPSGTAPSFRKNDVFYVVNGNNAGAQFYCTANGSGTTVAVIRFDGTTNFANFASGDVVLRVGSAHQEDSSDVNEVSQAVTVVYNYVTDHRVPFTVTDRAMATKMYFGESEWDFQKRKAMQRFIMEKESKLIFGTRKQASSTANSRTETGGLYTLLNAVYSRTHSITAAQFTESQILGTANQAAFSTSDATTNTSTRTLFMSGKFKSKMFQMMRDNIIPSDLNLKKYGIDVDMVKGDYGTWDLVYHPILDGLEVSGTTTANGVAISADISQLGIRYLSENGVDLKYQVRTDIQTPAATLKTDEFRGVYGLDLNLPGNHLIIKVA